VSGLRTSETDPVAPPVPLVQPDAGRAKEPATRPKVATPAQSRISVARSNRRPASQAWPRLLAPLQSGEGIRIGALGVSGAGKTTTLRAFMRAALATDRVHLVLVHDVKGPQQQYPGLVIYEATEVISHPPTVWPALRVMRRRGLDIPSVETAAKVTIHASYHGVPTLLNVDEFSRALTPSGREFTAPSVGLLLSEGRALGASLLWSAQIPQRVPPLGFDQSRILLHRQGPRVIAYLVEQRVIDTKTAEIVAQLQTGEFVVVAADEDFDGHVYFTENEGGPNGAVRSADPDRGQNAA
jgi:hypothetical protein